VLTTIDLDTGAPPPWAFLVDAIEELAAARSLDRVSAVVRKAARRISGADGVTVVLREGERVHYVDEDAIAPLWKGQSFPIHDCVSGRAMLQQRVIVIPDIYADPAVPHAAYHPTFVRSLTILPVGGEESMAAIGAYWAQLHAPGEQEIALLQSLARATATALANVALQASLLDAAANAAAQAAEISRLFEDARREAAERERAEAQLRHVQKLEAIGNLTGGIAHDFNNLLAIIIGNLDWLRESGGIGDNDELLRDALDAAVRGADMTRRLLAFARRQPLKPQAVDVNDLVGGITRLLRRSLSERIEIVLDLAPELPAVVVDPAQLEASLTNLANNARDAMPDGGRLAIATRARRLDADYAALHADVVPGDYVMIEVADRGCGMSAEVAARIFEPFFTTKVTGRGTGLGLSMVFGFVKQSGGHITVYSEPGVGTAVGLYLPVRAISAAETAAAWTSPARGSETVLVVEDSALVRRVAARQLERLGYAVLEAQDAAEAMTRLEAGPVDLLFTDVVMPGAMTGPQLARAALGRWPHLKVLLTSGFPEAAMRDEPGAAALPLLTKPYRAEELAGAVREVLGPALLRH
jgi:signal transduction histidine kinase/CheY-like chemotaxis protein